MTPTYSVACWDHDIADNGDPSESNTGWSTELAADLLGSPSDGMTIHDLRRALRKFYADGWSEMTLLVNRDS